MSEFPISVGDFPGSILRDGKRRKPRGFSRMKMPDKHKDFAQCMAVETFTIMVNHGHTFQDALTAVYLSGIDHALNARRDEDEPIGGRDG